MWQKPIRPSAASGSWMAAFLMGILLATIVSADVPSHCLKWEVLGTWDLKLSSVSSDADPLCGHTRPDDIVTPVINQLGYDKPGFEVVKTGYFTLKSNFSDEAVLCVEGHCEDAQWTMVYDEAMSIRGKETGTRLLFHFVYIPKTLTNGVTPNPKDATSWMSRCDRTYPGWFGLQDKRRGCAVAKNRVQSPATPSVSLMSEGESPGDGSISSLLQTRIRASLQMSARSTQKAEALHLRAFDMNKLEDDAILINKRQKFWVADASAASFASEFSLEQALRSVGGLHEKLLKPKSFSLDSIQNPELKAKEQLRRECIRKVLPQAWDWSTNSATKTPVIDQGSCGSCYAVSSADAFTSRLRLKFGQGVGIRSAKAIFQCSTSNQGCEGGFPWLVSHHAYYSGLVSDECAGPYQSNARGGGPLKNQCDLLNNTEVCTSDIIHARSWGYVGGYYGRGNAEDMMWSLYRDGPMVVAINAQSDLFLYRSGLYVAQSLNEHDIVKIPEAYWEATTHAIVLVGYGTVDVEGTATESWKLKNSWGERWGENGYFNMQRGVDAAAVESMPVHTIFGDGKPGNPHFEENILAKLDSIGNDSCNAVIREMLAKELV